MAFEICPRCRVGDGSPNDSQVWYVTRCKATELFRAVSQVGGIINYKFPPMNTFRSTIIRLYKLPVHCAFH